MDLQLAGTKALVMGSRKGIGRAISETFLAERAFVAVRAYTASDVDAAVVELEPHRVFVHVPHCGEQYPPTAGPHPRARRRSCPS